LKKVYPILDTLVGKSLRIYFQKLKEAGSEFSYEQLLNQSLEAYQKEIEKIIEEECKKVGETSESLLEKLSEIHRAGQSQLSKDDYNNFLVGYFYCIAASKEKEGKIMSH
jgi:hypothetical protein